MCCLNIAILIVSCSPCTEKILRVLFSVPSWIQIGKLSSYNNRILHVILKENVQAKLTAHIVTKFKESKYCCWICLELARGHIEHGKEKLENTQIAAYEVFGEKMDKNGYPVKQMCNHICVSSIPKKMFEGWKE